MKETIWLEKLEDLKSLAKDCYEIQLELIRLYEEARESKRIYHGMLVYYAQVFGEDVIIPKEIVDKFRMASVKTNVDIDTDEDGNMTLSVKTIFVDEEVTQC